MRDEWPVELPGGRAVNLSYWGRWIDGRWWAQVWWWAPAQPFRPAEADLAGQLVLCSGWTWSTTVRPLPGVDYTEVPRIELAAAPDAWPDPALEWATRERRTVRHQGLMGNRLGEPVTEGPPDQSRPPRRAKEPRTGQTLAQRAQRRERKP